MFHPWVVLDHASLTLLKPSCENIFVLVTLPAFQNHREDLMVDGELFLQDILLYWKQVGVVVLAPAHPLGWPELIVLQS